MSLDLPPLGKDCLIQIFSYFSAYEICRILASVAKEWKKIAEEQQLWQLLSQKKGWKRINQNLSWKKIYTNYYLFEKITKQALLKQEQVQQNSLQQLMKIHLEIEKVNRVLQGNYSFKN